MLSVNLGKLYMVLNQCTMMMNGEARTLPIHLFHETLDMHNEDDTDRLFNTWGVVFKESIDGLDLKKHGWMIMLIGHDIATGDPSYEVDPVIHFIGEPMTDLMTRMSRDHGYMLVMDNDEQGFGFLDGNEVLGVLIRPGYYCGADGDVLH